MVSLVGALYAHGYFTPCDLKSYFPLTRAGVEYTLGTAVKRCAAHDQALVCASFFLMAH